MRTVFLSTCSIYIRLFFDTFVCFFLYAILSDYRSLAKACLVFTTVPCCLDVFDVVAVLISSWNFSLIFISPQLCHMTFSIDCASLPRAVAGLHSFFRSRDQCFAVWFTIVVW